MLDSLRKGHFYTFVLIPMANFQHGQELIGKFPLRSFKVQECLGTAKKKSFMFSFPLSSLVPSVAAMFTLW